MDEADGDRAEDAREEVRAVMRDELLARVDILIERDGEGGGVPRHVEDVEEEEGKLRVHCRLEGAKGGVVPAVVGVELAPGLGGAAHVEDLAGGAERGEVEPCGEDDEVKDGEEVDGEDELVVEAAGNETEEDGECEGGHPHRKDATASEEESEGIKCVGKSIIVHPRTYCQASG